MITHVIYHVPGRKVGCTRSIKSRSQRYLRTEGSVPEMVVLEELHDKTDQEAGDIEWEWADRLGYDRDPNHYANSVLTMANAAFSLTPEQRRNNGKKGGFRLAEITEPEQRSERARWATASLTPEQRRENARKGIMGLTPEQRRDNSRRAGLVGGQRGAFVQRGTCPYCGMKTHLGVLPRHVSRCQARPLIRKN